MTIFDDFTDYGRYKGKPKEYLSAANLDSFVKQHGKEWVAGYLNALESVAIGLADILQPSEDVCGFPQTPHMVRTNLKKYWSHNKSLILSITPQIETLSNGDNKPELK